MYDVFLEVLVYVHGGIALGTVLTPPSSSDHVNLLCSMMEMHVYLCVHVFPTPFLATAK